jgi:hypothetical protein
MQLLKEAEYMAAIGFTLTPANGFALGAGSIQGNRQPLSATDFRCIEPRRSGERVERFVAGYLLRRNRPFRPSDSLSGAYSLRVQGQKELAIFKAKLAGKKVD